MFAQPQTKPSPWTSRSGSTRCCHLFLEGAKLVKPPPPPPPSPPPPPQSPRSEDGGPLMQRETSGACKPTLANRPQTKAISSLSSGSYGLDGELSGRWTGNRAREMNLNIDADAQQFSPLIPMGQEDFTAGLLACVYISSGTNSLDDSTGPRSNLLGAQGCTVAFLPGFLSPDSAPAVHSSRKKNMRRLPWLTPCPKAPLAFKKAELYGDNGRRASRPRQSSW
ncbi:unnamed protein product [Pleuronectes platessa]|uniref:Uncharacterized protein n=1 Tax=Pleuronectes platessa TaxID=8262 RepID=A0A9N7Z5S8_PLEPL|nr:unnamed protein product [Pleuronectes platessa]